MIQLALMPSWLYFSRPSNIAYHNLCSSGTPPHPCTRSLLGLGLNFCLRSTFSSKPSDPDFERFRKDIYTRMLFAGSSSPLPPKALYMRSNWEPKPDDIPIEFRARVSVFINAAKNIFYERRSPFNLLPHQAAALKAIKARPDLIVWKTDKNLGPAIIERDEYIRRALVEHLLDATTYRQLTPTIASARIKAMQNIAYNFIATYYPTPKRNEDESSISRANRLFLTRSLDQNKDPFAYFYLLAKIHKKPWVTRPIVSYSGSLLHGLGRWADRELQRICRHLPFALRSSTDLVRDLRLLDNLPPDAKLFTCDAVSMYTNIDTKHALSEIETFLAASDIPALENVNTKALVEALKIIMGHNVFRFGDTYWAQLTGTAMGTPPACMWATLYFAIHEERVIPQFADTLDFYRRFIDDGFGLWKPLPDPIADAARWSDFQKAFSSYGKLSWEFSTRSSSVDFLDLTITITKGRVETCLYEKALNLYLYLPPHSAHPPGVLKGLIYGMLWRINKLTTNSDARAAYIQNFYRRLRARGYSNSVLSPLFDTAISQTDKRRQQPTTTVPDPIYLHLPFHPSDPPSRYLQSIFRSTLLEPPGEPRLPLLENKKRARIGLERMVVAYHRPRNLGNILTSRHLPTSSTSSSVSNKISEIRTSAAALSPLGNTDENYTGPPS